MIKMKNIILILTPLLVCSLMAVSDMPPRSSSPVREIPRCIKGPLYIDNYLQSIRELMYEQLQSGLCTREDVQKMAELIYFEYANDSKFKIDLEGIEKSFAKDEFVKALIKIRESIQK